MQVESATNNLQARITTIRATRDRLEASFACIHEMVRTIDTLRRQMDCDNRGWQQVDVRAMESRYAGSYTTEIEREVLRAALRGAPLPQLQQNLSGNDVELF